MKKIIIAVLVVVLCTLCGCNDDEIINIIDSDNSQTKDINSSYDTDDKANIELTAENIETNDSQPFVVYVTGEVNNPGVFEVDEDKRIIDAIYAAGGYTERACVTHLNLASPLSDGQMIYVPSVDEMENGIYESVIQQGEMISSGNSSGNGLVNLNTASKEELMTLPGIGESKAEKIISYRETNGKFSSPEGIMEISGIKDGLYNKIKDRICVK
ncbi:MAG: helix-hairpin-helix domain-containing protein [Lachnospiraceae bacterium]|nr:helix-hairpin-helix domain-containing protein [Lachnospiraceae bacterium]